ncbi:MAG: hypothetical protein Q6363_000790 [Candidatus Njordarchaeota archaeon]
MIEEIIYFVFLLNILFLFLIPTKTFYYYVAYFLKASTIYVLALTTIYMLHFIIEAYLIAGGFIFIHVYASFSAFKRSVIESKYRVL